MPCMTLSGPQMVNVLLDDIIVCSHGILGLWSVTICQFAMFWIFTSCHSLVSFIIVHQRDLFLPFVSCNSMCVDCLFLPSSLFLRRLLYDRPLCVGVQHYSNNRLIRVITMP